MATKSAIISDIILRITKGKPSDDLELEPKQVAYWIDMVLGSVVQDKLNKQLEQGKGIESIYLKKENCIKAAIKNLECRDCQNNVYIELEQDVLSLFRDRGLVLVGTEDGDTVEQTKWGDIFRINKLKFSRPSLKNIQYTRDGCRLYLHGLNRDTYIIPQFMVVYVPKIQLLSELKDADEVNVTDDVLEFVSDEVEKLARRQMYQSDSDEENDSQQDIEA